MSESELTVIGAEQTYGGFAGNRGPWPSSDGDVTLYSSDNQVFVVHSTWLGSVSTVLRNMLPYDHFDKEDCELRLPQSSEVLKIVLQLLIQDSTQPSIDNFALLDACLEAANAYKLFSLVSWFRSLLWMPDSAVHISKSPIEAYSICSTHNFEKEKNVAFQHCIETLNISDSKTTNLIASRCRDATIALELIGRLARRSTIILKTLSSLHVYPMNLRSPMWAIRKPLLAGFDEIGLACADCQKQSPVIFQPTSWLAFWAHFARKELLEKPGSQCDHVFKTEFLCRHRSSEHYTEQDDRETEWLTGENQVCQECLKAILFEHDNEWEKWAEVVKSELKDRLGDDY